MKTVYSQALPLCISTSSYCLHTVSNQELGPERPGMRLYMAMCVCVHIVCIIIVCIYGYICVCAYCVYIRLYVCVYILCVYGYMCVCACEHVFCVCGYMVCICVFIIMYILVGT